MYWSSDKLGENKAAFDIYIYMVCVVFIETHTKKIANGKKSVVSLKMRDKFSFFIRCGESCAVC